VTGGGGICKKSRQIFDPDPELLRLDPLRVIFRVIKDTEDLVRKILGNRSSHSCEALHKEVDRLLTIKVK
jgi:hypothetical protein